MSVKLVIDSASDISKKEADKLGLIFLPLSVFFGEDKYLDSIDLSSEKFYELLEQNDDLPKTSQVTPYEFGEKFKNLIDEGHDVVAITLSSKLSGTYSSAVIAAGEFDENRIFIVDSLNATVSVRILIEYAISLVEQGLSAKEIYTKLEEKKNKIRMFFVMETLEYLYKGGRLSKLEAMAGNLLSVKPILTIKDGLVTRVAKARGYKKACQMLVDIIEENGPIDNSMPYSFAFTGKDSSLLDQYKSNYSKFFDKDVNDIQVSPIGCTVGTHIGPGCIGVAYFIK
ncbi:DegV family protein [Peptostreptococcus equinus]|uniref:DegV family protein n=1 Tax=Peptostreptococcus equinus TaxID=3003601 RepID=A0ABY7JR33_9FIRM|nr:DegV family protein [Peptostreptococcus sp. CBA3647]WAW15821.1 DegV family protein [Peptostreptococcus sp. CBA3647]